MGSLLLRVSEVPHSTVGPDAIISKFPIVVSTMQIYQVI